MGTKTKTKLEYYKGFNLHVFAGKARRIYELHREELEKQFMGKVVAIEVDSGDYFIGKDMEEATKKAERKYPGRFLHYMRVGGGGVWRSYSPVLEMH